MITHGERATSPTWQVSHPFIVQLHATFEDETQIFLLFESILGGELFSILAKVCAHAMVLRWYWDGTAMVLRWS